MALPAQLENIRRLVPRSDDYVNKLILLEIDPEVRVRDLEGLEEFTQALNDMGLSHRDRAGISRILGSIDMIFTDEKRTNIYEPTVADLVRMTDDELKSLNMRVGETSHAPRRVQVVRALFGPHQE